MSQIKRQEVALSHPSLQSLVILALTPSELSTTREIPSYLLSLLHPSSKVLQQVIHNHFPISTANQKYLDDLTHSYQISQRTNLNSNLKPTSFPTYQTRGSLPAQEEQTDSTHTPPVRRVSTCWSCRHLFGLGRSISHQKQKSPHCGPGPPHRNHPQVCLAFISIV